MSSVMAGQLSACLLLIFAEGVAGKMICFGNVVFIVLCCENIHMTDNYNA